MLEELKQINQEILNKEVKIAELQDVFKLHKPYMKVTDPLEMSGREKTDYTKVRNAAVLIDSLNIDLNMLLEKRAKLIEESLYQEAEEPEEEV